MLTDGMGGDDLLVWGLGSEEAAIELAEQAAAVKRRQFGGSHSEYEYEVNLGTKLLLVNGIQPPNSIKGFITVKLRPDAPARVTATVSSNEVIQEQVTVTARRIVKS